MANSVSVPPSVAPAARERTLHAFDVGIAAAALLLLAPLIGLVCLLILIESGRPVFFRQRRLGRNGQPFLILKFKKFRDARDGSGPGLTVTNDTRMTRVGAWLQRTKIDEVPQFVNVLRGEMAIVGPRPESLTFADCFHGPYREVLRYRPGIFGPNQVLFRHEDDLLAGQPDLDRFYRQVLFPLKASADLLYFSSRTTRSDLRLLFRAMVAIGGGHASLGPTLDVRVEQLAKTQAADRMASTDAIMKV